MAKQYMLKECNISKQDFNMILASFAMYTRYTTDLKPYKHGYSPKNVIYYTEEYLICTESHLSYLGLLEGDYVDWKQVICRLDNELKKGTVAQGDMCGTHATAIVMKQLRKDYTEDEIKERLGMFEADYDYAQKQYHILNMSDGLRKYSNCIGYDINGAHNDALRVIFPKSAHYFEKLYEERKVKPNNKKIANYFVGNLKHKGFEKTYNWIVQRTTSSLLKAIDETDGLVIYANTDGFITQNNAKFIDDSKILGEFKIEMQGDLYTYRDKNYWCIQYIDSKGKVVLKGNVMNEVRDKINLFEGKVVHYDKIRNEFKQYEAINITEEIVEEIIC